MATIERRIANDGKMVFGVKVRRQGAPALTATLPRLTDARKWIVLCWLHLYAAEPVKATPYGWRKRLLTPQTVLNNPQHEKSLHRGQRTES